MQRTITTLSLSVLLLVLPATVCPAGSIWNRANSTKRALHSDDTARKIGDILTIVVDEHSKIENETNRKLNKKSTRKASISHNLDILNTLNKLTGEIFNLDDLAITNEAETDFDGGADYDSDRSVKDEITVAVQDVLPNGNLVLLGRRERKVAGDMEIVEVSGIVRPSDITFANAVSSDKVADFQIVYYTQGRENRFTKPGWLDRILNIISPF